MYVISARNVCEALPVGIRYLQKFGERRESRNGPVMVARQPVTTVYERPWERVLFSAERNANPFFHLMESLWMLAGRNDGKFLDQFISTFSSRYGEPDSIIHDAYGYRWRFAFGFDQLDEIVKMLKKDPNSRQAVLQMWDALPNNGLDINGMDDLKGNWKTRPCNTHAYFLIQNGALDMTVCCRSNDIIWGAYGANAVHFSILQEYLAAAIGVPIGLYYQVSNNYHAYVSEFEKYDFPLDQRYTDLRTQPLVSNVATFLPEVFSILEGNVEGIQNNFLRETVLPMMRIYKTRQIEPIRAPDWAVACQEWIERRKK